MKKALPFLLVLGFTAVSPALEDTPDNRAAQAERYLQATPASELVTDMAFNMASQLPRERRDPFIKAMTEKLDIGALSKAIKKAMIKNFSADELKALADFYSSPEGKSAMKKMGTYMADVMPAVQAEVKKAVEAADKDPGGKN